MLKPLETLARRVCAWGALAAVAIGSLGLLPACAPKLDLGERTCSKDGSPLVAPAGDEAIPVPWSTGFENRFCDYEAAGGGCYGIGDPGTDSSLVTDPPAFAGRYSAAFRIVLPSNGDGAQARCVLSAALPTEAYYSARYFIPAMPRSFNNWNLFHFDGGPTLSSRYDGKLDVSLEPAGGGLKLVVHGLKFAPVGADAAAPQVPIGQWFRIRLYVKRAGAAGELKLYQDDQQIFDVKNVGTDDSALGHWYVGNLAYAMDPPDSTVYVDDVTISNDP